jgi:hypothetical protein
MTNPHPITPPPELVQQWMELEACAQWTRDHYGYDAALAIRATRRPKPPSLKEQALTALSHLLSGSAQTLDTTEAEFYIRRALEQLPND